MALAADLDAVFWQAMVEDGEVRFTFVSQGAERVLGHAPRDFETLGFWERHIHPDDREETIQTCLDSVLAGEDHIFEYRWMRGDGEIVWIRDAVRVRDPGSSEVTGVMLDVTDRRGAQEASRVSARRMRLLVENMQDTVFRLRLVPDISVEYVSPSCEQLTGYRPEEWYADPLLPLSVVHPDDRGVVVAAFAGDPGEQDVTRWVHRDGRIVWVEMMRHVELDDDGRPVALEGVARDVTERHLAAQEARLSRALFESSFRQAPVGMALVEASSDPPARLTQANETLSRMLGIAEQELLDRSLIEFAHPDSRALLASLEERLARGEMDAYRTEARFARSDGMPLWASIRASSIHDADGRVIHGLRHVEDISDRVAYESDLRHRALHDMLTDLPNRQLFMDRVERALAQRPGEGEVGLLFADIDDLKSVNDRFGHAAGDRVIREVARRLQSAVRPGDTVARLAGDEFTILCPEIEAGSDALRALAERVLATLADAITLDRQQVTVTASIGAAVSQPGARSADELIAEGDAALIQAKRAGKSTVVLYDEQLGVIARERRLRETEVRDAVERGEFELHYQPIVGLVDREIISVEALVRWRHPERGVLAPAAFIPVAERLGVLGRIGRWVLEHVCADLAAWVAAAGTAPPRVSINVSPGEIASPGFADAARRTLESAGCKGQFLCFEITESGIIEDPVIALENIHGLKDLGCVVALDDFGKGYSSLGQLASLPVDILKLDRVFVSDISADGIRNAAMISAVCSMAAALEMRLVAEGIETEDQRRILLELGCEIGQGFLFARPEPLGTVSQRFKRRHGGLFLTAAEAGSP